MITSSHYRICLAVSLIVVATMIPGRVSSQSISSRVAAAREGKVRMTFAARPGVCGYGNSISRGGTSRMNWNSEQSADVIYDDECSAGPIRVVLTVDDGRLTKLRTYVGGRWRAPSTPTTDLGVVSARDAAGFLTGLAEKHEGSVGREAIMPATLADSVVVWPALFRIARDVGRPTSTRKQALFWLGQAAADRMPDRESQERNENSETELKKQAVFALSQRKNGEAVPALIQVARNNRDSEVRKSALFWLGQTTDVRAIALFEEILSR